MVFPIPILLMYSIQPTLSLRTYNCCSGPPNIWALGPPPKPPWLKYNLDCNAKGIKMYENNSINSKESTAALQDKVLGDLTAVQLVILLLCVLLLIVVLIILIIYVKRKYKATVKPDIVKDEETNYLYNYRVLGRAWRGPRGRQTSWRGLRKTTGPEDHKYLVNGTATPSSTLSLASNETAETETAQLDLDDEKDATAGTRRSSTSSGIGTSQGDSGPELGSLTAAHRPEFPALPILAPIKSNEEPDMASASRTHSERFTIPNRQNGEFGDITTYGNAQNAAVSLHNPLNWNIGEERTSAEQRHGALAPISHNTADGNQPKRKRKKKKANPSSKLNLSDQNVPLQTISNGKLNSKLSPIPDVSGESQA